MRSRKRKVNNSFVWLVVLVSLFCSCSGEKASGNRNVILISVDTLRADHLGCYGYFRDTSPFLDKMAEEGFLFRNAVVQWPKTWPSLASLLSSTYPATNGIYHHPRRVAPASLVFLSEILKEEGYRTFAVVSNYNVGKKFGFDQGFDLFIESWMDEFVWKTGSRDFKNRPGLVKQFTNAAIVTDQAMDILESRSSKKKFFLWLHYMDPHGPYLPPKSYENFFPAWEPGDPLPIKEIPPYQRPFQTDQKKTVADPESYKVRYDREIRYFDDELKRLVSYLKSKGLYDNTVIIITADHGESLDEHGYFFEHGKLPYQPSSHVPLIILSPQLNSTGRVIETPVGLIDVVPTLCDLIGISKRPEFEGASLLPLLLNKGSHKQRAVFTMAGYNIPYQKVIRWGDWKLIHVRSKADRLSMTGEEYELYNIARDPGESDNIIGEFPEKAEQLKNALLSWDNGDGSDGIAEEEKIEHDAFSIDMLKSLGYIQ